MPPAGGGIRLAIRGVILEPRIVYRFFKAYAGALLPHTPKTGRMAPCQADLNGSIAG